MKNTLCKRLFALGLAGILALSPVVPVFAAQEEQETEEAAEGDQEQTEGEAGETPEGEEGQPEESPESEGGEVSMTELESSNGRYIAASYPEDLLPEGFHKSNCTYSGQKIDIARMDNDDSGEVVLAYLADADGSNGDFYLCDVATAMMSDFVQIKNGNEGYIIVLDPGDVIVAPAGYTRARLEWYGGKSVTAWLLPSAAEKKTGSLDIFGSVPVYAAGEAAAGDGEEAEAEKDDDKEGAEEASEEKADEEKSGKEKSEEKSEDKSGAAVGEDGSGVVYADPSDFFMVYAIDNTGTVGFYIYDKVQKTYQRYVVNSSMDSDSAVQYKNSAQIRLYIIVGMAFVLVILIFVLVNILISRRDDDDGYDSYSDDEPEEYPEEEEEIRVRSRAGSSRRDRHEYEDYGNRDEAEEEPVTDMPSRRSPGRHEMRRLMGIDAEEQPQEEEQIQRYVPGRRASQIQDAGDDMSGDLFSENRAPARSRSAAKAAEEDVQTAPSQERREVQRRPVRRQPKRLNSQAPRGKGDERFDEDFNFEFINLD